MRGLVNWVGDICRRKAVSKQDPVIYSARRNRKAGGGRSEIKLCFYLKMPSNET
jgi:hypothetical protein